MPLHARVILLLNLIGWVFLVLNLMSLPLHQYGACHHVQLNLFSCYIKDLYSIILQLRTFKHTSRLLFEVYEGIDQLQSRTGAMFLKSTGSRNYFLQQEGKINSRSLNLLVMGKLDIYIVLSFFLVGSVPILFSS